MGGLELFWNLQVQLLRQNLNGWGILVQCRVKFCVGLLGALGGLWDHWGPWGDFKLPGANYSASEYYSIE